MIGVRISPPLRDARRIYAWLDAALVHAQHPRVLASLRFADEPEGRHPLVVDFARKRGLHLVDVPLAPGHVPEGIAKVLVARLRTHPSDFGWTAGPGFPEVDVLTLDWAAEVFVYGSNLQGRNGKGAALHAQREWGARPVPEGRQFQCYALPTKATPYKLLPVAAIRGSVDRFLEHARQHPGDHFLLTRVGTGLAGVPESTMAEMFVGAGGNITLIDDQGKPLCAASDWVQKIAGPSPTRQTLSV